MSFIDTRKMKNSRIFLCRLSGFRHVRFEMPIDFHIKILSRKLEKRVWNSRESFRLDLMIWRLPA